MREKIQWSVDCKMGEYLASLCWDLGKIGLLGEEDRLIERDERQLGFRAMFAIA